MKTVAAVVAAVGRNVSSPAELEPAVYPLLPVNQNKMKNGSEEESWGILSLRTRWIEILLLTHLHIFTPLSSCHDKKFTPRIWI
jgi:hypothetical protein